LEAIVQGRKGCVVGGEHARGASRGILKLSATRDFALHPEKLRDGLGGDYAWPQNGGLVLGKGNHGGFNSIEAGTAIEN
jgi:hypothetical protein